MKTREQAIQWWNGFEASTRESLCSDYYKNRQFDTLTGREIEEIFRKENKTENIYLNRLEQEYRQQQELLKLDRNTNLIIYQAMRLFCLDTQLISFNDVEIMESEVNQSF